MSVFNKTALIWYSPIYDGLKVLQVGTRFVTGQTKSSKKSLPGMVDVATNGYEYMWKKEFGKKKKK